MKKTVMIIGFGHHSKRIYYRILEEYKNKYDFVIVELDEKKHSTSIFLADKKYQPIDILYLPKMNTGRLNKDTSQQLDRFQKKYAISGVIIATDPQFHPCYGEWALKNKLPILMDKPISVHANLSTVPTVAKKLVQDYHRLKKNHQRKKTFFSVVSQRRFHPAFQKAKRLISEIIKETECPVTSIQITHSDGQWRFPNEIIDIPYHSFNQGYGKCSHSGYHFFDIMCYLLAEQNSSRKAANNVEIHSTFVRPIDYLSQLTLTDYEKNFPGFSKYNQYSLAEIKKRVKNYGEIDAFVNLSFKKGQEIITVGTINLIHNGFSQRGTLLPKEDLYKGNGRVRHESYIIEQGPFQCLHIDSLQSKEVEPNKKPGYDYGGEFHFDIHVFRNSNFNKSWKGYEKISLTDFSIKHMRGKSRGHQEDARKSAVIEFFNHISGKNTAESISDLNSHENTVALIAGSYKSAALKFKKKNPIVNVPFKFAQEKQLP